MSWEPLFNRHSVSAQNLLEISQWSGLHKALAKYCLTQHIQIILPAPPVLSFRKETKGGKLGSFLWHMASLSLT